MVKRLKFFALSIIARYWYSGTIHLKFKKFLNETFTGFLMQSARQDVYGFSLRVNHLWFKLDKKPLFVYYCFTSLGIQASFDKTLQESQWILHHLAELHNTNHILAIKMMRFWSKDTTLEWNNRETVSFFLNKFSTATKLWYKIISCTYE